jgi:glycosyltransferase involved in cell wall biosynthesis
MTQSTILCVGNGWFPLMPGGLNRYVYELINQFTQRGTAIELCGVGLPSYSGNSSVQFTNLSQPNVWLGQRLLLAWRNFITRQVSTQPDAINLHFALYSFPLLSALPPHIPVTFTFHGPWALEGAVEQHHRLSGLLKYWIEQRVYQRCDRFIVLSQAFGEILHQHYQVPWNKIHRIPGGVDTQRFQPHLTRQQARQQLNWPIDRPILFTPRRLVHRMGLDNLLTALVCVKQQIPDVWLAIAGKGALRDSLEQHSRALGLGDTVQFLGFVPEQQLPIAYQAADLTVIPSQALEGFGLVVLESLACGTPVICTPVGGMPEIVMPFSPDWVTDSTEPWAIAERLTAALTGDICLPSRASCREYAVKHFDWQVISPQVEQVLLGEI